MQLEVKVGGIFVSSPMHAFMTAPVATRRTQPPRLTPVVLHAHLLSPTASGIFQIIHLFSAEGALLGMNH